MENIRSPAVAGSFYPADPETLNDMIERDLSQISLSSDTASPKVLIVPHAGYIFSGPIAASAFALLKQSHHLIKRVVIIGPSHRVGFSGVAISNADYFDIPLGRIAIDKIAQAKLLDIEGVHKFDAAHAAEHSLEVQLPFLQYILDDFSIVPIVAGDASPKLIAEVIKTLWGGPETLFVISSDLSHYHDYQTAQLLDQITSQAILNMDVATIDSQHACGSVGIRGLLTFAQHHPMKASILDLRNSGDTAGSKDKVVGYGAYSFTEVA
ncbi:MAG: AmmeMemoRadiSam system protein B [Gammaproteobacteria bacterium]|nr:MAG: AmmeMemoRadiSam system protein B [Gammaproteobacteria bacterium]RKZ93683.1 MAG: AmmeMemoRadiSam system protein B [Gammaproteobacteria bacterium]